MIMNDESGGMWNKTALICCKTQHQPSPGRYIVKTAGLWAEDRTRALVTLGCVKIVRLYFW